MFNHALIERKTAKTLYHKTAMSDYVFLVERKTAKFTFLEEASFSQIIKNIKFYLKV